jgi:protocatechuate 3,4-dioxygenase beta subunit
MMKRRGILAAGAVIVGGGALGWWQRNTIARTFTTRPKADMPELTDAVLPGTDVCRLTPEQVEGPFFIHAPVRSDIREDRSGMALDLQLQIVRGDACTPVQGAVVEAWHCDAAGRYSGYREDLTRHPFDTMVSVGSGAERVPPANQKRYLRGAQTSDAQGMVRFKTIFPGWYEPRATHIHIKVFERQQSYLTTQLYFPEELVQEIYSTHPDYAPHGACPYNHRNDLVLAQTMAGDGLLLNPVNAAAGLHAGCRLALS